jgi:uncharacterized protein YjaZ
MAGYAVGLRIVDAHLARSGLTVAQSTALNGPEIRAGIAQSTPMWTAPRRGR